MPRACNHFMHAFMHGCLDSPCECVPDCCFCLHMSCSTITVKSSFSDYEVGVVGADALCAAHMQRMWGVCAAAMHPTVAGLRDVGDG